MKQLISIDDYKSLSELARLKWKSWCIDKGYGSAQSKEDFIEIMQPDIGLLLEFLIDSNTLPIGKNAEYAISWEKDKELVDVLYLKWRKILES